ncbi:MAG: NAD-dependent epimerase [Crocinitomicaceae bacterium]|nr:NAD-dependent epimerase [Crocinitomicaceae bacterium]|tara:strand:+ start:1175 stop:2239 length:1065 start_codon:yes stop_codon:yes gene_type:complete
MKVVVITGSGGLVGVEAVKFFSDKFDVVVGIDNDSRGYFFGKGGSVAKNIEKHLQEVDNYVHYPVDIRDKDRTDKVFGEYGTDIKLVINTAAQPSHDWSGRYPLEDFEINALGAVNMLEKTRQHCPDAVFIQCSSSKVYGDVVNKNEFIETETRYDFPTDHTYYEGFREDLPVDQSLHSPYGSGKLASDSMSQEYARYYGMKVGIFRPNCITGGPHSGVELHGFLSYLVKCTTTYNVFGYKGKQIRDNIHAYDLVRAFNEFYLDPKPGEVYNLGGGRANTCSILEAIDLVKDITGKTVDYVILDDPRVGDHIWWIGNNSKFIADYPNWSITVSLEEIIKEIHENAIQARQKVIA